MSKRIITVREYDPSDLVGDPRAVLESIQSALMEIPEEHRGTAELEIDGGYDGDDWVLNLIYEREESPEEIQADKDARKRRVAEEEAKEREILDRLLRKHGWDGGRLITHPHKNGGDS